ncbi:MAG: Mth938-like domain-containing protein [Salibaculum sp.]|jgi:uncharacterized protein|uniref:Mth938-like domain-containing protein n=1 Tax=Salibaculum sp. TaxID=2855480 RepID=UPI00286FF03E|nr:Mth938-like domain-containing protein [Salibaculum sp.]MDR9428723.1 Mth938-like domain-containing protein [Salibaculum sp.]MDR9483110.1 Mth938-like domain-containing protein [Salibaculum sp.]
MRMNEVVFDDARPVDGYGPGFFRIGGEVVEGAVIVSPRGVSPWAGLDAIDPLLELGPVIDVLLVGTGAEIAHLPRGLRTRLEEAGIGVEFSASPAACRTYNVLLAEGRRVGLALLPV